MKLNLRALRQADARGTSLIRKAASICLSYPGVAFPAQLALVESAVDDLDDAAAAPFLKFAEYAASQDPYDLAAAYVETFDQRNHRSMYLTWWTAGDSRNRGEQLIRFIAAYRAAGYEYGGEELPDHLPVVLDFAASGGDQAAELGGALLAEHRDSIEKLRESLARAASTPDSYPAHAAELIGAVLTTVPPAPGEPRP